MNRASYYALLAYVSWGLLPFFWKWFQHLPPGAILSHRIVWSFLFVAGLLLWARRLPDMGGLFASTRTFTVALVSALLIGANWLLYIAAVNADQMVEASLGYYINPLMNVVLGVVFLKEKPTSLQWTAIGIAATGVLILTVSFGKLPWIALLLAITFALYGFVKKKAAVDSLTGLSWETLILVPFAAIALFLYRDQGALAFHDVSLWPIMLAGIITALPLLWFAAAAKGLPLATLGLFQYVNPTVQLLIGVLLFREPFTGMHIVSFACIWSALLLYVYSSIRTSRKAHIAVTAPHGSQQQV